MWNLLTSKIMCTVTLSYNQNNALARRKLAALLATGLFTQRSTSPAEQTNKESETYLEEREAFMSHSKKSMSHVIARYLWSSIRETLLRSTSFSLMEPSSLSSNYRFKRWTTRGWEGIVVSGSYYIKWQNQSSVFISTYWRNAYWPFVCQTKFGKMPNNCWIRWARHLSSSRIN